MSAPQGLPVLAYALGESGVPGSARLLEIITAVGTLRFLLPDRAVFDLAAHLAQHAPVEGTA